ncbi:hypothetical protein M407DRAFT_179533 [Tulasnella calospora MUT 4182]|uniref:Uncharacterized protein n=1 Tax=Tulasnella calospora MUT 4182 TaxID=1051891 RepID=A0A0C3PQV0_9AGAM|nr:hypothetical protein M407DRAFT_179533 [Tulasnella calospora MUT 4182]
MSTTQDIECFTGSDWKECSAFIQRVRAVAWKEGKLRDPDWVADFASLYFSDDALAWYCRLSPDVQENWPKLQAALVERWSPSGGDDHSEPPNVPVAAAAAAPSGNVNDKINYLERGILKASVTGKQEVLYVHIDPGKKLCTLTNSSETALRFRFNSQSNSQLLECADRQPFSWLATHWNHKTPNLGRDSLHYARLTEVDCDSLKSPAALTGPLQLATCKIAGSGKVTFLWRDGTIEIPLVAFYSGNNLSLVPDGEAFGKRYWGEKPVTFLIQKVD